MSSKLDKSAIVGGAGLVASIFTMLVKKVRELGGTDEDIHRLSTPEGEKILAEIANLIVSKHIINCDADPFVPERWRVESHKKGGQLEWDPNRVRLHLSPNQKDGKYIEGNKLRKELADEPTLNANVLNYLLSHPELIPEEWKGRAVFFWGTIYRGPGGILYVRGLYWGGKCWRWYCHWLGGNFSDDSPALLRASN